MIPHILPGDNVRTPDGVAKVKRVEGRVLVCEHLIRSASPGSHPTRKYKLVRWDEKACVRTDARR